MKEKKKKKFRFTQRILLTWIWTIHSFFMEFSHIPYQSSFILLLAKILDKPIVFLLGHQISKKRKKWWIPLIFFIRYKRLIVNLQNFSSIKRFNAQNEELDWICSYITWKVFDLQTFFHDLRIESVEEKQQIHDKFDTTTLDLRSLIQRGKEKQTRFGRFSLSFLLWNGKIFFRKNLTMGTFFSYKCKNAMLLKLQIGIGIFFFGLGIHRYVFMI